jgi:cytochrome c oxidase assembly protein subunit 15
MVWIMVALLSATLIQMVLGTQVREMIDVVKNGPIKVSRENWLDVESTLFLIHRSFSWLIVIGMGALIWVQRNLPIPGWLKKTGLAIVALINLQILIGIGLERLAMPGVLQVLHLSGVSILICLQFAYILAVGTKPQS